MCMSSSVPKVPSKSHAWCTVRYCILFQKWVPCRNRKCYNSARNSLLFQCVSSQNPIVGKCSNIISGSVPAYIMFQIDYIIFRWWFQNYISICILKDTCQQISYYFTAAHHLKAQVCVPYITETTLQYTVTQSFGSGSAWIRINLSCWIWIRIQNVDTETLIQ